jgi:membrane-associated phospholipid phosphatase
VSAPVERWLGLTNGERPLAHPRVSARYASALIGLVVLLAILIPDGPLEIDERWSELMRDAEASLLTHAALVFNALGHGIPRALTIAGVGLVLLIARRRAALLAFAVAEALTPLLVNVIKQLIGRERPPGAMIEAHGSSFPSGHAAYAGATAVMLVLLFTKPGRPRRAWWVVAAVATAAMAWSRTYLQVHWLSDALAGATLGVGVALLSVAVVQILSTRPQGQHDQPPGESPTISPTASSIEA